MSDPHPPAAAPAPAGGGGKKPPDPKTIFLFVLVGFAAFVFIGIGIGMFESEATRGLPQGTANMAIGAQNLDAAVVHSRNLQALIGFIISFLVVVGGIFFIFRGKKKG